MCQRTYYDIGPQNPDTSSNSHTQGSSIREIQDDIPANDIQRGFNNESIVVEGDAGYARLQRQLDEYEPDEFTTSQTQSCLYEEIPVTPINIEEYNSSGKNTLCLLTIPNVRVLISNQTP